MELVDLYNEQKELIGKISKKKEIPEKTFRLCVHIWIEKEGKVLLQQRLSSAHQFPNMWSVTGGVVKAGESSLDGALRELDEELGIHACKGEMQFLASYRRKQDYVDVWLLKKEIKEESITMQKEEVQDVKWATLEEFETMLENKTALRSSYDYYKLYQEQNF